MRVDGNLKRLEQGLISQQRTNERSYWERAFLHLVIPGPHKPMVEDIELAARTADEMLKKWRARWGFIAHVEPAPSDEAAAPPEAKS